MPVTFGGTLYFLSKFYCIEELIKELIENFLPSFILYTDYQLRRIFGKETENRL